MSWQNIKWLTIEEIYTQIENLARIYNENSIVVINEQPLRFVAELSNLQNYYNDIFNIAAVIIRTIIKDHPLLDGNKRLGVTLLLAFLEMNGFCLCEKVDDQEIVKLALDIAKSKIDREQIVEWLKYNVAKC